MRVITVLIALLMAAPTPAISDDQITCTVNIDAEVWLPEQYGKSAEGRCDRDDIIYGSIMGDRSKVAGVVFYASVVCRMDRQVVVAPDGQSFSCVFRGASRQVRSLFGSAPEKKR